MSRWLTSLYNDLQGLGKQADARGEASKMSEVRCGLEMVKEWCEK